MAYFRTGGGGKIEATLLGTLNSLSTSNKTMTLDESIDNYQWVIVTMTAQSSNGVFGETLLRPILRIMSVEMFKTAGPFSCAWGSGGSGAITTYSCDVTYLTDTTIRFKLSASGDNRNAYVYGIK